MRYHVHSITGYGWNGGRPGGMKLSTSYCVLDSWDCYREVQLTNICRHGWRHGRTIGRSTRGRTCAERNAALLNREHEAWLRDLAHAA